MSKTGKIDVSFIWGIRVRDSDPLGPRLAERGLVARAARACRRCAREALQYSPTHTIVWGTPIISRFRGYLEVITLDSDARRVQRPRLRGHCRAEELGCLHPNREQDFVDQVRPRRQVQREHVQDAGWRRGNGCEADELPLPHPDFQHRSA